MRLLISVVASFVVFSLAYWAYSENYKTQASIRRVNVLQRQIGAEREAIAMLYAEWAYLNRPERLRELVDLNFEALQLLQLTPGHFGDVQSVAYPLDETQIDATQSAGQQSRPGETRAETKLVEVVQ